MKTALTSRKKLINFELRQDLEAAFRPNLNINSFSAGQEPLGQGRISIGVLLAVINQISIMSEFETAMQPFVQSRVR